MLLPLATLLQLAGAPADTSARGPVYHGLRDETAVAVPRLEGELVVDGRLDEPAWREAAILTGFSQYSPVDGVPAADSTEVLVWYSAEAIHFGIRAFEPHGLVHATLADRDRIASDDYVQILLDTYDDGRRALVFGVNPLGVQSDGTRSEAVRQRSGSFSADPDQAALDLSPDFVFQSRGRPSDDGYEIEIRIPFKSIRYQDAREQSWGLQVIRRVQHSGHEQTWTAARRDRASFLAQGGRLEGLSGLDRGLVLDLNPVATMKVDGGEEAAGWRYAASRPELGANVRWGVTPTLTLNGTVNPDFSQVESDAGQLVFDPRQGVFVPEKRPFFLEGSEHFDAPSRLVYSRRIASPVAAAKLTGKVAGADVGLLSAVDDAALSPAGDQPIYNILRVRRDVGRESTVGVVYTDRIEGDAFNRVAGADARLVFGRIYSLALQGAASVTGDGAGSTTAALWNATLNRTGRRFGLRATLEGVDPEFRAAGGFISRPGIVHGALSPRLTVFGAPGARIESWSGSVVFDGTWLYDRFMDGGGPEDIKLHLNNSFALRGGWRLGASLLLESFAYPAYLYADYAVERRLPGGQTDTVPFTGTPRIGNLDVVLSVNTPEFARFGGSFFAVVGRDENFYEWAPAYIAIVEAGGTWRPTDQVRAEVSYARQQYVRPDDWSTVAVRDIPRLKVEYQLSRALFLRFVGQYDRSEVDDLRDDSRTGDPILIRDPESGVYRRALALARRSNRIRADWLLSYQPTPGTVLFAGYGSSLVDPEAVDFRDLRRTADGFFVKVSYLFRM